MMETLRNITAGEPKKLIKPIIWTVVANLMNIVPFGCLTMVVSMIYKYYADGTFNPSKLWFAWGGMVVFMGFVYLCENMSSGAIYRDGYGASADGRSKLAEHIRKLPLGFLMSRDPGEIGNTMMNDFAQIEQATIHFLPHLISGFVMAVLSLCGLFILDWRMAIAVFAGLPITIIIIWVVGGLERKLGSSHSKAKIEQSNRIQEYLFGMKVMKAYNLCGENFERLEKACYRFMKECIKLEGSMGPFYLVAVAFLQTGLSLITITGVYLILDGEITIPRFTMFLLVGTRIFDPLAGAITKLPAFKYYAMSGVRIIDLLKQPVMKGEKEPSKAHNIIFENVTFGYNKNVVLDHVSAEMKQGTLTAIVGPSGSGKSTMLRLISRFYDPQSGKVLFGGIDEQQMDPEKLMKKISVVFQDVYLFQDTIYNNIRYGRENATKEEVEAAAKAACCHEFITKLPNGYNTMVGEGGSTLSGGEKQRISIARAMLKNAPVILLDEATSSLDPENEVDIQKAISRLIQGRTVIMIAHRLKTVVHADNIIVLERGKVVEQGTHEYLLKVDGLYKKLWALQMKTSGWKISV